MLSRRGFLAMATAVPRPSIVFVPVDQWRAQALGYRGGTGTPVPRPLTRHGVVVNEVELRPSGATLEESFRKARGQG